MTVSIEMKMLDEIIQQAEQGTLTKEEKQNLKLNLECKIESTRNRVIKAKSKYILSII